MTFRNEKGEGGFLRGGICFLWTFSRTFFVWARCGALGNLQKAALLYSCPQRSVFRVRALSAILRGPDAEYDLDVLLHLVAGVFPSEPVTGGDLQSLKVHFNAGEMTPLAQRIREERTTLDEMRVEHMPDFNSLLETDRALRENVDTSKRPNVTMQELLYSKGPHIRKSILRGDQVVIPATSGESIAGPGGDAGGAKEKVDKIAHKHIFEVH